MKIETVRNSSKTDIVPVAVTGVNASRGNSSANIVVVNASRANSSANIVLNASRGNSSANIQLTRKESDSIEVRFCS